MSSIIKFKAPDPKKFKEMSKADLEEKALREENAKARAALEAAMSEHRVLRMGSLAGTSLAIGLIYEVRPGLENIAGTPASLDHIAALGGTIGAFMTEDETLASALEGVGGAGLGQVMRGFGRRIGSAFA